MTDHIGSAHMTQGFNTSFVADRFGNENSALALNGGWTQVPPGVYFNTPEFTISIWVLPQIVDKWSRVIDFGNGAPSDNVVLTLDSGTNKIPILAVDIGNIYGKVYSTQSLTLNNWQHLAASFDGIKMKIYLNGALMSEEDYPVVGSIMPKSLIRNNCYVGKSNWANNGFSSCYLDDLRFYNKSLSQSEINEVMNDSILSKSIITLFALKNFEYLCSVLIRSVLERLWFSYTVILALDQESKLLVLVPPPKKNFRFCANMIFIKA
jgi:hypothetical protein